MAQTYTPTFASTDFADLVLSETIPDNFEALRSMFSGASEPSNPVAYQPWADTATGWLKFRNAGNTAWVQVAPLATDFRLQLAVEGWAAATVSASKTDKLAIVPRAGTIKRIAVLSGAATSSSSGNEWQFVLTKYPASAPGSPVAMFSGTVGTFTALGGVGGGAEMVANAAYFLTPNQNATVADGDVIELTLTKVGSIGNLTTLRVSVSME